MNRLPALIRKLQRDRGGAVAVEFAILAPLLCLMLFGAVEFARMWSASRQFEATVTGVTRHLARYPEYDSQVRDFAPPIARALAPFGSTARLNLTIHSLTKTASGMTLNFPAQTLFGTNPGTPWSNVVNEADYVLDETVIVVTASYAYQPMFAIGTPINMTFKKSYATLPAFNRRYPYNSGKATDKYVY